MKKIFILVSLVLSVLLISSAQVGDSIKTFFGSIESLIADALSGLLLSAGVAAFFYNIFRFILARDGKEGSDTLKDAKERLLWSILALTAAFSIWGVVQFLQSNFGFTGKNTISAPQLKIEINQDNNRRSSQS